jgi:hypothetical protein
MCATVGSVQWCTWSQRETNFSQTKKEADLFKFPMSLQYKLSEKGVLDTRTQYIQAFIAEKREQFISMPRQREGTGRANLQDSSLEEKEARKQASHSLVLVGPIKRT